MSVQATSSSQPSPVSSRAKSKKGLSFGKVVGAFFKYSLLLILSFSFLLPLFWMVSSAVKDDAQVYTVPPIWIPDPAYPQNFINAWTTYNFNLYAFNTLFRFAIPVTIGVTLSSALVAYGFSRVEWKGRNTLFFICLTTMMVPFQVTMVPLFIIFKNLGWVNTFYPLVVPAFFGAPYFIFLLRQFFMSIPTELSDSGAH